MEKDPEQQSVSTPQREPTTRPTEAEFSDEQLDHVAGGRETSGLDNETQVVED